jgi:hypothetical protein
LAAPAASVAEQYPYLAEHGILDELIPKKEPLFVAKWWVNISIWLQQGATFTEWALHLSQLWVLGNGGKSPL